jgi:hypothetical protein
MLSFKCATAALLILEAALALAVVCILTRLAVRRIDLSNVKRRVIRAYERLDEHDKRVNMQI